MANPDEKSAHLADQQASCSKLVLPSFSKNFNSTTFDFAAPRGKRAKKAVKKEKLDIKLWDLEVLITNIGGQTLQVYFEKILEFLLSEDKETEFPNISSHLEELLVRIVNSVEILDSEWMNVTCRQICYDIIDIVKSKAATKEFILSCSYKAKNEKSTSQEGSHYILVYRKECPPISSQPSTPPISRSSSIDSIYLDRSAILPTDHLKSQSLNLILNFIKDKTLSILEFNMLNVEEAEFVTSVFDSIIADSLNKKLSVPLWEVHRIWSKKYVFSVQSLVRRNNWRTVRVEKNPKNVAHGHQLDHEDQSERSEGWRTVRVEKKPKKVAHGHQLDHEDQSERSEGECEWEPSTGKGQKKKAKYETLKSRIEADFITGTLRRIVNLFQDETEASVTFSIRTIEERWFLRNILNFARSQKVKAIFKKGDRKLFDEILKCIEKDKNYKLKLKEDKRSKRGIAEIIFHKQPVFLDNKNAPESQPNPNSRQWSKKGGINFKSLLVDAMQKHVIPENHLPDLQPRIMKSFEPVQRNINISNCSRTNQLIEALSVPVQSDKALKMMQSMGWTGGGLGSKGDGIREPLMPHLSKGSGAGLGHNKSKPRIIPSQPICPQLSNITPLANITPSPITPLSNMTQSSNITPLTNTTPLSITPMTKPAQPNPETLNFRHQFLYSLYELITTDMDLKVVKGGSGKRGAATKKETMFLKNALITFTARSKISLTPDIQPLVDQISAVYEENRGLNVTGWIADDSIQIFLKKTITTLTGKPTIANINLKSNLSDNAIFLMGLIGPVCQKQKARDMTKFCVEIILHFLKFVTSQEMQYKIQIGPYNHRQRNYITSMLRGINTRAKFGCTDLERMLSMEFLKFTKHSKFKICVEYDVKYTTLTVKKEALNVAYICQLTRFNSAKSSTNNSTIDLTASDDNSKNDNDNNTSEITDTGDDLTESDKYDNNNDLTKSKNKVVEDDCLVENVRMVDNNVGESSQVSANVDDILDNITDDDKQIQKNSNDNWRKIDATDKEVVESNISEVKTVSDDKGTKIADVIPVFGDKATKIDDVVTDFGDKATKIDDVVTDFGDKVTKIDDETVFDDKATKIDEVPVFGDKATKIDDIKTVSDGKATKIDDSNTKILPKRSLSIENDAEIIPNNSVNENEEKKRKIIKENVDDTIESVQDLNMDKDSDLSHIIIEQYDNMSISDISNSQNLDISAAEEDVLMADSKSEDEACISDSYTCDEPLELSFNYEKTRKTLNVDLKPNLDNTHTDVKIVFLTKKYLSDIPKYIQGLLSLNIVLAQELPLLKCHGVQNGALVYSCHTKKSFEWLESICVTNNIILTTKEFDTMSVKINWFFEFDDKYFFNMLEMYNQDICTKDWIILKKEVLENSVIFEIRMDKTSFKFILDSNLELYSGVDKVTFSIIWE